MAKQSLNILAGPIALQEIRENGLDAQQVKLILGASGGPKWLVLSRLDQYLNDHFLSSANQPITLLGSSVGAWRMALYATENPGEAFRELESLNLDHHYHLPLSPAEIRRFVDRVLDEIFIHDRREQILSNPNRNLQIVAVRNRRYLNGHSKLQQAVSLCLGATANVFSPTLTRMVYPRVIISQQGKESALKAPSENVQLDLRNFTQSLIASGSIPLVMDPIKIPGSKERWHWDGAIVDYHYAGPFREKDGLILYPHFSSSVIPGWFDKALPWRRPGIVDYARVVMLVPSREFVTELPHGKIPDRRDFSCFSNEERRHYWQMVLQTTDKLVDDFDSALAKDGCRSLAQPLRFN